LFQMHTDGTASQARNYTKNYVLLVEPHFAIVARFLKRELS
jgi:hypothetical protein